MEPLKSVEKKLPKLKENDKEYIEQIITLEELNNIIKKSKNNKSPGPDGFSNEFYKCFWPTLKILLLKLLNSYRDINTLNPTQLEGIITCILKGGKSEITFKIGAP